jgi:hypothetical protein
MGDFLHGFRNLPKIRSSAASWRRFCPAHASRQKSDLGRREQNAALPSSGLGEQSVSFISLYVRFVQSQGKQGG